MARILVTGGAGFIGSHVVERLLARGDEVVVLDNFNDFYDPAIKRANAALLTGAELVEGDLRDAECVAGLVERDLDGIVHLAAMAGVRPSISDPLHYVDVNVHGTQVLLSALVGREDVRFVFGSSSSVYGGREDAPFRESDDVSRPISPYAATKVAGEVLVHAHQRLHGNPTACLRFFTVYGPRQRPEMAIHRFVRRTLEGRAIPFFGDGESRRDYTFVEDIVDGVVRALDRCDGFEIVNLGGSHTTSLAELVAAIGRATGVEPSLERLPDQPGDVPLTAADVTRANELYGWEPRVGLDEGLERFVAWYRALDGVSASDSR